MSMKRAKQIRKALRELISVKTSGPGSALASLSDPDWWLPKHQKWAAEASEHWDGLAVRKAEYLRAAKVMGVVDGRGKGSHSTERSKSEKPSQPEAAPEGL
jgi:hypothetical protein